MQLWCKNKKVEVWFSSTPDVDILYPIPNMSDEDFKKIRKKPFINKETVWVMLKDKKKDISYQFMIEENYPFDGASIPKLFWRVIGSNTDNTFLIPAMIHDKLCENHEWIDNDKNFSTEVFNCLLEANKVNPLKRYFMKHSVNIFQCFCGWNKEK
jgi:hypothetical protein